MGRFVAVASAALSLCGCANLFYAKTPTGSFSGKLDIEWIAPNQFIYRPDPVDPLHYVASDGKRIQPRTMYTDGGSIPRFFWALPNFGPWDFAPGFIVHDWLFVQRHCKEGDWQSYTLVKAAQILAEAIKTQMVRSEVQDAFAVWAIYEGVTSPIAEKRWETGECRVAPVSLPPAVSASSGVSPGTPIRIMTINLRPVTN